jgi:hypothetical protein
MKFDVWSVLVRTLVSYHALHLTFKADLDTSKIDGFSPVLSQDNIS